MNAFRAWRCWPVVLAGLIASAGATQAADEAPSSDLFKVLRGAIAEGRTMDSKSLGFGLNQPYREVPKTGKLLVGFKCGIGKSGKTDAVYALQPIYRSASGLDHGEARGLFLDLREGKKVTKTRVVNTLTIMAKPGYAVGGATLRTGLEIGSLSLRFMKIKGDQLDPADAYSSETVGDKAGGGNSIDTKGAPIVGVFGTKTDVHCSSLGFVHLKVKVDTARPPDTRPKKRPPTKPKIIPDDPEPEPPPRVTQPTGATRSLIIPAAEPAPPEEAGSSGWLTWLPAIVFGFVTACGFAAFAVLSHGKKERPETTSAPTKPQVPVPAQPSHALEEPVGEDIEVVPEDDPVGDVPPTGISATPSPRMPAAPVSREAARPLQRLERVGFGRRLGAQLIDSGVIALGAILIGIIGTLLGAGAGKKLASGADAQVQAVPGAPMAPAQRQQLKEASGMLGAVFGGFFGGMFALMLGLYGLGTGFMVWEGLTGAALGKRILGIRICAEDGTTAVPDKLLLRTGIKYSAFLLGMVGLVPLFGMVGALAPLASLVVFIGCWFVLGEKRQAFHDMAAHTAVYPAR
jgi:uncharacterized RDD family membrane protein YckC